MCLESMESMMYAVRLSRMPKLAKVAKESSPPGRMHIRRDDERIPHMNIKPGSIAKGACTAIGACVIGATAVAAALFAFTVIELPRIERRRHV